MNIDNNYKVTKEIENFINDAKSNSINPVVVIRCITYNQEKYISQTLEGFVKQKTNFPFVAIIHDDASTDNTAKIITKYAKKYPEIIKPVCDSVNRYSEKTLSYVMETLVTAYNPKYVALCEGDDYWTDSYKLQKQVDYLDKNSECVMCHTNYDVIGGKKRKNIQHYDDEPYFGPGHIHSYDIGTLTAVYRKETFDSIPHLNYGKAWKMGDYPLWIELSSKGKFHYLSDITSCYRILPNSASHSINAEKTIGFYNNYDEITKFYCDYYGYEYIPTNKKRVYLAIVKKCLEEYDYKTSRKYTKIAIKEKQLSIQLLIYHLCIMFRMKWLLNMIYKFYDLFHEHIIGEKNG